MRPVALRRIGALLLGLGLLGSLAVSPVLAASITVNVLGDTTADDGFCTLREAIIAANTDIASGGTIGECVAGSGSDVITFSLGGTITLTSDLPIIFTNMSIAGGGAITVSGNSLYRMFNANASGTLSLSGLTITEGLNPTGGGGIKNSSGTVTVADSTIIDNHTVGAVGGGGIYNSGTMTVTNTTISGGNAFDGGGIYNDTAASLIVVGSTISGNVAVVGGGIYSAGTMTATNTTISGNTSANTGGGIHSTGTLTVADSTISGNTAPNGGGIFNNGAASVTNSTISGNTANSNGGGIFTNGGGNLVVTTSTISGNTALFAAGGILSQGGAALVITNSTISGNTSSANGGGILNTSPATVTNSTISGNGSAAGGGGISAQGTEQLLNTIVAGNTAPTGPDIDFVAETITTSIIGVPGGKTLADILVSAGLANNGGPTKTIALALVAGNPAIDTATGAVCAASPVNALDQRGQPRPTACDIGAYEAQSPTVAAQPNASVAATSASGAAVTYTTPAGTDEQGGVVAVTCLPASGSTFPVGSTTVTCTATDAVGHTGTRTFQVNVGSFVLPDAAMAQPSSRSPGLLSLIGLLGLLGVVGLRQATRTRRHQLGWRAASAFHSRAR